MASDDEKDEGPKAAVPELVLDDKTQRSFVSWFHKLPQDPHIVRFFDRKTFYSVHGPNASLVAQRFYKTTAVVKTLGAGDCTLAGVTLNRNLFEQVLRELLLEGNEHVVELYEGTGATWRLARTASPGLLSSFDEELFRTSDNADLPVVMAATIALVEGQRVVGVAYVDGATRRLGAAEFAAEDDQLLGLEAVVMQLGARECVMAKPPDGAGDSADHRQLREVLQRCGAMPTDRPRSLFGTRNLEGDLARLVKGGNVEQHRDVLERKVASMALAAVIGFAELLSGSTTGDAPPQRYTLSLYDPGQYMRLDAAAQRALNVLPTRSDANNTFSLYGLMNRARSAMGKRRLKVWLKQPLVQLDEIVTRHDVVEAFVTDTDLRERLRDQNLRGLPDVERLGRKLGAGRISLAELCQLYRASAVLPLMEEALRCHEGPHASLLVSRYADTLALAHDSDHLTKFEELLEAAIDLDRVPEEYLICASYDPRLQGMLTEKEEVEQEINTLAEAAARDLGLELGKSIKLEWHKAANMRTRCLRITNKEEKAVRSKLQSRYQTIETRKDGTKFTNKSLRQAAERLTTTSGAYDSAQKELVEQVVKVAQSFTEVWEMVAALLSELDVLLGFADLAVSCTAPYVRPTMLGSEQGEIRLMGSRHPCVEAQEGVSFIKNDCQLARGDSWFQIITGPNMGGKSTYIRQVGACVLMAQVGSFVPCDSATIAVRDAIFARVGAGDCQLRGVSTFMAEMLETASILKGATEKSLIIIDELGRGTSTYDGFGLAWAIGEHLMNIVGAPVLFATHFHELTDLTGPGGVRNRHVSTVIDPTTGKLTMLYQLKDGACDQSFGIHVAESAAFPPAVVELAKQKLAELEGQTGGTAAAGPEAQGADAKASAPYVETTGMKRKRDEDATAAAEAARAALRSFAELPVDQLGAEAALEAAERLLAGLEGQAVHNPILQGILQSVC